MSHSEKLHIKSSFMQNNRLLVMKPQTQTKNISRQVNFRLYTKKYISNRSLDHKEFKYDHRIIEIYISSSKTPRNDVRDFDCF